MSILFLNLAPTTPLPTQKLNVYSILKNCPEAVHCMTTCNHGYSLETRSGDHCPTCSCNRGTCTVSTVFAACYFSTKRVDTNSLNKLFPTWASKPTVIIFPINKIYLYITVDVALLQCPAAMTCQRGCKVGYRCGTDGCPGCQCVHPTGTWYLYLFCYYR